jgi:hypothetical protein
MIWTSASFPQPQIAAARKDVQVDEELQKLVALLPGLELRFERMKADLLMKLLTQPHSVADRLVALRAALPSANVAAIATTLPSLLTSRTPEELTASVQSIRYALQNPCDPGDPLAPFAAPQPKVMQLDAEQYLV